MSDKTKEQAIAELQARIKGFNEELFSLLKKYKLGLGGQPLLVPSKDVSFGYVVSAKPIVFDDSEEIAERSKRVSEDEKSEGDLINPEK